MAIPSKVIKYLEKSKAKYETVEHRTVYTAYDKSVTLKVPQKIVGKTLVVRLDRIPALVLVPANKNLDKQKLRKVAKAKKVDFIKEAWMKKNLKGVKVGAIPPFGNLWKSCPKATRGVGCRLPTFVDRSLLKSPKVFINAGDYNWSIKIRGASLKKLVPDLVAGTFGKAK